MECLAHSNRALSSAFIQLPFGLAVIGIRSLLARHIARGTRVPHHHQNVSAFLQGVDECFVVENAEPFLVKGVQVLSNAPPAAS
jgi:hypothetical protein